jgi:hypothetical protein
MRGRYLHRVSGFEGYYGQHPVMYIYSTCSISLFYLHDKREKEIFLIYKEIQMGSVEKVIDEEGLYLKFEELCKYLTIYSMYEEAVSHI